VRKLISGFNGIDIPARALTSPKTSSSWSTKTPPRFGVQPTVFASPRKRLRRRDARAVGAATLSLSIRSRTGSETARLACLFDTARSSLRAAAPARPRLTGAIGVFSGTIMRKHVANFLDKRSCISAKLGVTHLESMADGRASSRMRVVAHRSQLAESGLGLALSNASAVPPLMHQLCCL